MEVSRNSVADMGMRGMEFEWNGISAIAHIPLEIVHKLNCMETSVSTNVTRIITGEAVRHWQV